MKQLLLALAAAALMTVGGYFQVPWESERKAPDATAAVSEELAREHPEIALLSVAPGGLRVLAINALWIRSQELHLEGKHHDAYQLARLICMLQPRFPGVWKFQSWQMAWNISVTTHTADERWQWVYNGISLLRDDGAQWNPTSYDIYHQLAWTFMEKVGGDLDEFHMAYKERWAKMMQDLLAPKPFQQTAEVIRSFQPIANAPLNKAQGFRATEKQGYLQRSMLDLILNAGEAEKDADVQIYYHPQAAEYVRKLSAAGVEIGQGLLDAYNRYSLDPEVQIARDFRTTVEPAPDDTAGRAVYDLINSTEYAEPRNRLLAFVRAQLLWNKFKMDPQLMMEIMVQNGVPLDWRVPAAHSLYWMFHGLRASGVEQKATVSTMRLDRIVMNSLKDLTWYGRVVYVEDASKKRYAKVRFLPDWRYMEITHQQHIRLARGWMAAKARQGDPQPFNKNKYKAGHINYLAACISNLYLMRRKQQALYYLRYIRRTYTVTGEEWQLDTPPEDLTNADLAEFTWQRLFRDRQYLEYRSISQMAACIQSALMSLLVGDREGFNQYHNDANRIYDFVRRNIPERSRKNLAPMRHLIGRQLEILLVNPRAVGVHLSMEHRIALYRRVGRTWPSQPGQPGPLAIVYDRITPMLKRLCLQAGEPFEEAFPPPEGLREYRSITGQRAPAAAPE